MNIYFACSITGGREFEPVYQVITRALTEDNHHVPTAHLAESGIISLEAIIDPFEVYSRDVNWIRACDVLIAEVSAPSHGVGYEIGYALGLGKPVLALYQEGCRVSKMISGNPDPNLLVMAYESPERAVEILRGFLSEYLISEKHH
ncbi:MAG TPA: nucleoside 2-deoxyribosyltransferase [Anaerolineales bacterium]|nr:nucleoside 2-deoxyribosyltransferase [Anaerolineales bacterium]